MRLKQELADARRRFDLLNFYGKFEQIVIFILTVLIAVFVIFAVWNLALKVLQSIASSTLDPTDYSVFQTVFGAILTVIIALEFKKSLLVSAERQQSIVQVRTVILIALLAVVRKVLILDLAHATTELFALAAAIIALGAVYWLVRDQDRSIAGEGLGYAVDDAEHIAELVAAERRKRRDEFRLRARVAVESGTGGYASSASVARTRPSMLNPTRR